MKTLTGLLKFGGSKSQLPVFSKMILLKGINMRGNTNIMQDGSFDFGWC
jgi:hypothetical protein